ncbi:MAG: ABC transporter ATP-binding protein [Lunatimonas sp.]|uniref:ABC transporter ATP-binding protein n=1 Tax=Lunatimonas sp. TaxID=2060141 RepID=UPI00263B12AE|nr:ABC transporter ATP-binding protein [Lunatimonas sp.]MCC5936406.1 ABC transporter ATP-binding protein [Lunatimonas sp.]
MKSTEPSIRSSNLEIGYRPRNPVFGRLDFAVRSGEVTCLMGPNGVGKSTLVKTILGIIPPLSGELWVAGEPVSATKTGDIAKKVAVVLTDRIAKNNLTVKEMVMLGRIPHTGWLGKIHTDDRDAVQAALADVGINHLSDRLLSELSDGQIQKALIARALAQDGTILILDEPTAHLDLVNRYEIMFLLRELATTKNKAILVVTHDLDIALETADQFLLMVEGPALIQGTPEDLVIRGEINRLLPGDAYRFDLLTGKISYKQPKTFPSITGPVEWIPWIQNILKKHLILSDQLSIELKIEPFVIRMTIGQETKEVFSLKEMITFLKDTYS